MHADGADLEAEDAVAKAEQEKADRRAGKGKAAPLDQEEFLHGVGMHGDRSKTEYEPQKEEATDGKKEGPCEGMDCLHGVLMHGDMERGKSHEDEHAAAKKKDRAKEARKKQPPSVEDPHEMIHGHRKSIAETDEDNKRYLKHRTKDQKGPVREPLRLEFAPEEEAETGFWQSVKKFFRRLLVGEPEEEEEVNGADMDMRHDLESIGRTGPLTNTHSHDKKSKRREREEHRTNAHREHWICLVDVTFTSFRKALLVFLDASKLNFTANIWRQINQSLWSKLVTGISLLFLLCISKTKGL